MSNDVYSCIGILMKSGGEVVIYPSPTSKTDPPAQIFFVDNPEFFSTLQEGELLIISVSGIVGEIVYGEVQGEEALAAFYTVTYSLSVEDTILYIMTTGGIFGAIGGAAVTGIAALVLSNLSKK